MTDLGILYILPICSNFSFLNNLILYDLLRKQTQLLYFPPTSPFNITDSFLISVGSTDPSLAIKICYLTNI